MNIYFPPYALAINRIIFPDMFISQRRAILYQVEFDGSIITKRFAGRIQFDIRNELINRFWSTVSFGGTTTAFALLFLLVLVFFFVVDLLDFFLLAGAWASTVPTARANIAARRDNLIKRFFIF